MRLLLILPLLTACAHAPAELTAAKENVDSRMTHVEYRSWHRPAGMPATHGNCAAFAVAYWAELKRMGKNAPLPVACSLPNGQRHAVLKVDGWVLDNRYPMVVPMQGYDCKSI